MNILLVKGFVACVGLVSVAITSCKTKEPACLWSLILVGLIVQGI